MMKKDSHEFYFRSTPNWFYRPWDSFKKRALKAPHYYNGGFFDNSNEVWFSLGLPKILLMRIDGWEMVFPEEKLEQVYYSYMKRTPFYMAIISSQEKVEVSDCKYTIETTPRVEDLGWGLL